MRAIAAALLCSGCLYVGDVNRAPTSALTIGSTETLIKGATLQLIGSVFDEEDGFDLPPIWSVRLADETPDFVPNEHCDYRLTPYLAERPGEPQAEVVFNRTGNWIITFRTFDRFKAPSNTSTVMVTVTDAPPKFPDTSDLLSESARDVQCNTYVAGVPLALYFDGEIEDLDAQLTPAAVDCRSSDYDEKLTYRWEIVGLPATSHAVLGPKPSKDKMNPKGDGECPASPPQGLQKKWTATDKDYPLAVCVYPDVGSASSPNMYQIAMFVSDGKSEIRTNLFDAPVRADLPPCLTGFEPAIGSLVVDRFERQQFSVRGATDDLDRFGSTGLSYLWSVWREQDPVWRQAATTLANYELDTSDFGVGEKIRVRVEPVDRLGARAGCDEDEGVCEIDSCLVGPGQMCRAWMTWDLELR